MSATARSPLKGLPRPVNAWGTPTPWGVSKSSELVVEAVNHALRTHIDMTALQETAERAVCALSGAEAACFTHCGAAGLVLAAAAAMSGQNASIAAALPRCAGQPVLVLQEEHAVDFGQPIARTLALAGAEVNVLSGSAAERRQQIAELAGEGRLRSIVYVESQLVKGVATLSREDCASLARDASALFLVDAAAQDWRLADRAFIQDADLTVFSAQKYLAAPTCGVVVGRAWAIDACKLNQSGVGRPMKPTKEALAGLLAALADRNWEDLPELRIRNLARATAFAQELQRQTGWPTDVRATALQGPFPRVLVALGSRELAADAAARLKALSPPVIAGTGAVPAGKLSIELTHVDKDEQAYLLDALRRLAESMARPENTHLNPLALGD